MIVHFSVCDHCSAQRQIGNPIDGESSDSYAINGFEFCFCVIDLTASIKNGGSSFGKKYTSGTFCNKDCLIEFFKENMKKDGKLKNEE